MLFFAHKRLDGPRDATLDVDKGEPKAVGPRPRSQTRRAANNLSAYDRHSSDFRLHDASRNHHSDHHESDPCSNVPAPTAQDVRSARRAARASAQPAVQLSAYTSPASSDFFAAPVTEKHFTMPPRSDVLLSKTAEFCLPWLERSFGHLGLVDALRYTARRAKRRVHPALLVDGRNEVDGLHDISLRVLVGNSVCSVAAVMVCSRCPLTIPDCLVLSFRKHPPSKQLSN